MADHGPGNVDGHQDRPPGERRTLGICLGASTLSAVALRSNGGAPVPLWNRVEPHEGNPRAAFARLLRDLDPASLDGVAVTGRRFREMVDLPTVTEPEAVEAALAHLRRRELNGRYDAVVSAGGETFIAYVLDHEDRISGIRTGSRCASGTGEFFLQQIRRMDLEVEEAVDAARGAGAPHRISARCSVFCKSDCTHALNKGEAKGAVTAGLCEMMASRLAGLLSREKKDRVLVVGGTSRNTAVMDFLRKEIPGIVVPEEAPWFEALGAALWALDHPSPGLLDRKDLVRDGVSAFRFHPPLQEFEHLVSFREGGMGTAVAGDRCVVGLDVGSTTTKAVVLRLSDDAVLARTYRRTDGDPVAASRACYADLLEGLDAPVEVGGLGVTGSGRYIAALHALSDGVVNEIIAHATAAAHYDPEVDTIFEIGGQDAKYTHLTAGVPSDYAMNEACSAGTGSFLEEAAKESLGVGFREIGDLALSSTRPPDFNDQCSAFISSDVKNAAQEGIPREDIVAGLVYSVCMNYTNRVKGARPTGSRIFMQGGVCYNRAVPVAMAALVGKPIVVPPDPGLAGALGVALEVKRRIASGELAEKRFDLAALVARDVEMGRTFTCAGGPSRCDRKCEIRLIGIEGKRFPFGGACNRYYDLNMKGSREDRGGLDFVAARRRILFEEPPHLPPPAADAPTVGLQGSFLVHMLLPLYRTFFRRLGFRVVLPRKVLEEGVARIGAAFCHPAELAHGLFEDLLRQSPDFLFLPQVSGIEVDDDGPNKRICPTVQAEPHYIRSAFGLRNGGGPRFLTPVLDFSGGYASQRAAFVELGRELGVGRRAAGEAYDEAVAAQGECTERLRALGRDALAVLEADPDSTGVVLFGRPYNAFAPEANMGIPGKFSSRGVPVIPCDLLPLDDDEAPDSMYWATGRTILKAAKFVARHPRLFGAFVTNFSCGPDSFLLTYFRDVMGAKPSLTLELDSHTADAGITTRVEAALDIFRRYRDLQRAGHRGPAPSTFRPAEAISENGRTFVRTAGGEEIELGDPRVRILIPSMGDLSAEGVAASFRGLGLRAEALAPADEETLRAGLSCTTGKECLPLALVSGSLIRAVEGNGRVPGEVICYFIPTGDGPCRLGQYRIYIKGIVRKREIPDVAILSLSDRDTYGGLGPEVRKRSWMALAVGDVMDDLRNGVRALAVDPEEGLRLFAEEWGRVVASFESDGGRGIVRVLEGVASRFRALPVREPVEEAAHVALVGEIFVRRDVLSKRDLLERLAARGFVVKTAPVTELMYYTDYVWKRGLEGEKPGLGDRVGLAVRRLWQRRFEARIKRILAGSGFYRFEMQDLDAVMRAGGTVIDERLLGEAVVTSGSALHEIVSSACGVISIGPFGCMPSRIAEAVLTREMTREGVARARPDLDPLLRELGVEELPLMILETDGKAFPQVAEARLEAFALRAGRLHDRLRAARKGG